MPDSKSNPLTEAPEFRKDVVRAIQAIATYGHYNGQGEPPVMPSQRDCKLALDWIINEAGRYYDVPTPFPGDLNGRDEAFFNGRRFVAKQVVMAMQLKPELLKK